VLDGSAGTGLSEHRLSACRSKKAIAGSLSKTEPHTINDFDGEIALAKNDPGDVTASL
jgi:methionine synthase I (cobalamin-dependent)